MYQSLACAFANIPHDSVASAISLVEQFMEHVGSSRYVEVTDHFLIGRQYCSDFYSNAVSSHGAINANNIVLFGKIVACMGPAAPTTTATTNDPTTSFSPSSRTRASRKKQKQQQKKKTEKVKTHSRNLLFVIEYDRDILHHLSKTLNIEVPRIQLIPSELAWGGCILYERKTCIRRDASTSVIQNIDRTTSVETWIVPDMRMEELVEHPVSSSLSSSSSPTMEEENATTTMLLPMLTVYTRGYKFIFRVKEIISGRRSRAATVVRRDGYERQYGVFVSCTIMPQQGNSSGDQEINLKPGELIDLGIVSPLPEKEMDQCCCRKPLSSFLVKNYIHQFQPGRYATLADDGNSVYDLTDDDSGELQDVAKKHVLSYIRKKSSKSTVKRKNQQPPPQQQHPTIHIRLDPCGNVHLLFGIQYTGDWAAYENGMQQQFVPMFCGGEVEVTSTSSYSPLVGPGTNDVLEAQYLQSISLFSMEEIVLCGNQLCRMVDVNGNTMDNQYPHKFLDRCEQVVQCILERIEMIHSMAACRNDKTCEDGGSSSSTGNKSEDDPTNHHLSLPVIQQLLKKLSKALKGCR